MGDRVILHCDLNGFFASVEALYHPELNGLPMAVSGSPDNRHGIILAKNELAKKYGVSTGETIWQARKKCPGLCLVPPQHHIYEEFSAMAIELYEEFTNQVEPFGIDEAWLDVTGSRALFGDGEDIAKAIRIEIKNRLKLTASVGVSFNKVFAKLGSDYKKPDATTVILRENFKDIIFPLPVGDLLYVGKTTQSRLKHIGINTIGDLAAMDKNWLVSTFGKSGEQLHIYANGLDDEPVKTLGTRDSVKSVGKGLTFKRNLCGVEDIKVGVMSLSEMVGSRLRKLELMCEGVQVSIRNVDFKTIDRRKKLSNPTNSTQKIFDTAMEIIIASWNLRVPIRMLTVTAIGLTKNGEQEQLSLFSGQSDDKKAKALDKSLDIIRNKFGSGAIRHGLVLNNDLGIK